MLMRQRQRSGLPAHTERRHKRKAAPARQPSRIQVGPVGFRHTLHWDSEQMISQALLDGTGVEVGQDAPFRTEYPRHITSWSGIKFDGPALSFLGLRSKLGKFTAGMTQYCAELSPGTGEPLSCELGPAYQISGMRAAMEIDSPAIRQGRAAVQELLHQAGVAVPDMPPTHLTIAEADNFIALGAVLDTANTELAGRVITFDPLDLYLRGYTQELRPVQTHDSSALITV